MRKEVPEYVKEIAVNLRKNQTYAEQVIWSKLRNKLLGGYKFVRQYSIGRYIADFYCSKARVVIEIDGRIHDEADRKEYDKIRDEITQSYGIKVIRFSNEEVKEDIDGVLNRLLAFITIQSEF